MKDAEKSPEIAARLIKRGLKDEEIAAITSLAPDIVKKLRDDLTFPESE